MPEGYRFRHGDAQEGSGRFYVEWRNEREAEHSLQNLKDLLEGRKPA